MDQEAYVKEVIDTVKLLQGEIERLEREIKQTKEQIHKTVIEGLQYTCDEDQQHLAWEL